MTPPVLASFLILPEDTSPHAFPTLRTLVQGFLLHLEPRADHERIRFEPINDEAARLLAGNQIVASRHYGARIRMHRTIIDQLADDAGFVFHHVDADRMWHERRINPSTNVTHMEDHVRCHVIDGLTAHLRDHSPHLTEDQLQSAVRERMTRYILVVPYRELEAWLYQNTDVAERLCLDNPNCRGGHVDKLNHWRSDRRLLDELPNPPTALCLGKSHNRALAANFPVASVIRAGKSLAACLKSMRRCNALQRVLRRTRPPRARGSGGR